MDLKTGQYYHLYNRSNGGEQIFRCSENYLYFLSKFRKRLEEKIVTHAYCLMPTHFHFLVQVTTEDISKLKKAIGVQLASYTKAFNKSYNRTGSLFQQHTKTKLIDEEEYLITLVSYIHQNPIRSNLVEHLEEWPFSSYLDLSGLRNGTLVSRALIEKYFTSTQDFIAFSEQNILRVRSKYWV